MMQRRSLLAGLAIALAPAIIRTPGICMPISTRVAPNVILLRSYDALFVGRRRDNGVPFIASYPVAGQGRQKVPFGAFWPLTLRAGDVLVGNGMRGRVVEVRQELVYGLETYRGVVVA